MANQLVIQGYIGSSMNDITTGGCLRVGKLLQTFRNVSISGMNTGTFVCVCVCARAHAWAGARVCVWGGGGKGENIESGNTKCL
jgi:hypothetical protein